MKIEVQELITELRDREIFYAECADMGDLTKKQRADATIRSEIYGLIKRGFQKRLNNAKPA